MKILITGSAGFIGSHLAKKLIKKGYEIIGIDNLNDYYDVKLKEDRLGFVGNENFKYCYKRQIKGKEKKFAELYIFMI